MQRMFNLRKWTEIQAGGGVSFESVRPRTVRFEVNSFEETRLHIVYPEGVYLTTPGIVGEASTTEEIIAPGTVFFLGRSFGRDVIETFVEGRFDLVVDGGTLWLFTADGDEVHATVIEPVIFTRIAERKSRNAELEAIERRMYLNQQRMLSAMHDEFERRMQEKENESAVRYAGRDGVPPKVPASIAETRGRPAAAPEAASTDEPDQADQDAGDGEPVANAKKGKGK